MPIRLNTTQFLALRSIARGNWDFRFGTFEWRFNGKWSLLRRNLDSRLYDRAWDAAWELEERGLVEVFTVRCCPGKSCHANDTHEFRLTSRGTALLQKANAASQRTVAAASAPAEHSISSVVETPAGVSWWRKAASLLPWRRAS